MNKWFAALLAFCLLALSVAAAEEIQLNGASEVDTCVDGIELDVEDDIGDIVSDTAVELDLGEDFFLPDNEIITEQLDAQLDAVPNASGVVIDETNFPDEVFREYVKKNFDADDDDTLSDAEREAVTEIDVSHREITNLEGIAYFANLQNLNCYNNQLTSLEVSSCVWLRTLNCGLNRLTHLDIDGCSRLSNLNCISNQLSSLNIYRFPDLRMLDCGWNELVDLDISGCIELYYLDCEGNRLIHLDVSGCSALEDLNCSENNMTGLDIGDQNWLWRVECADNALTDLDLSGCPALEYLDCNTNLLTGLDIRNCRSLRYLNCENNALKTLDVDGCTELAYLFCNQNKLKNLDVSSCKKLEGLSFSENRLTRFSASDCTELESLSCENNLLTGLDLGGCVTLQTLNCEQNRLTSLDLGDCGALEGLYCAQNNLTALDVCNNAKLSLLICYGNSIPSLDITNCSELRKTWMNPKKTLRDGYKIIYSGKPREFFGSYGMEIDRTTALIVNSKPIYGMLSLSDSVIIVPDQTYTGKALKPAVTVKYGAATLKAGTDYTASYKNNKRIGTATVIVKGKGSYSGQKTSSFKINPKAVTNLKLQAGKGQLIASWKKISGVTGYQLQYGMDKGFSSSKKATVTGKTKKTLKNLKKGKTYYVRIRAYKKVNGKIYWSAWSSAKKAIVK